MPPASADAPMIGVHALRTSWDRNEPGLAPNIVGSSSFGPLFSTAVEGQVYAQPVTAGGTVVVATEANQAYGLDPTSGAVRWRTSLGPAWPVSTVGCGDLAPTIGVTSTPVYDAASRTVYMTSKVNDGADVWQPHWYMHALDAGSGLERAGWPVRIEGTPSNDPEHRFNPLTAVQRPGLLLLDGVVYAGFASHCDYGPYVGYVVGVNAARARISTMWSTESGTSYDEGGIWQSGAGLFSDGAGTIVLATGNGLSPGTGPRTAASVHPRQVRGAAAGRRRRDPQPRGLLQPGQQPEPGPGRLRPGLRGTARAAGRSGHGRASAAARRGWQGRPALPAGPRPARRHGPGPGGGNAALSVTGPYGSLYGKAAYFGGGGHVYVMEANGPLRAHAVRTDAAGRPGLLAVGATVGTFGFSSGSPVVTSVGANPSTALVWVVRARRPASAPSRRAT